MEFLIVCAGIVALVVYFARRKKSEEVASSSAPQPQPVDLPQREPGQLPQEPTGVKSTLPDGKYVVRFGSEQEAGEGVRVEFLIAAGPHSGSMITMEQGLANLSSWMLKQVQHDGF